MLRCCAVLLAALAVLPGCGGGKKDAGPPELPINLPPLDAAVVWDRKIPLAEAATSFCKIVERTINRGDERFMQTHMAYSDMLKAAGEAWKMTPEAIAECEKNAKVSSLPGALARDSSRGAVLTFLRVREVDKQAQALFRTVSREGVQYFTLYLEPDEHNVVTIVNTYSLASGMTSIQTLKRFLAPIALKYNKDLLKEFTPAERAYAENISAISYMQVRMMEGNYMEANRVFGEFPQAVKQVPEILLMHISSSRQLNDRAAYISALDFYCNNFKDIDGVDLMRLKLAFAQEKYKDAFAPLDRLEAKLGTDGMLDFLRSQAYQKLDDLPNCRASARKAIEHDPSIERAYYTLLDESLSKKDWDETIRLLERLEQHVSPVLLNLEQESTFQEFLKTDAYKNWIERRMQQKRPE